MRNKDLTELRSYFEEELDSLILELDTPLEMLKPMLYSLKTGGKRLRPLLLLAILDADSDKLLKKGIRTAIALEFIHTYSLVHDDLPAMDDDTLRRGQSTSHIKFDEATAILAGDALLTDAFGIIADDKELKNKQKVKLVSGLAYAAGSHGMVSGQLGDIKAEEMKVDLKRLERIHYNKTGKLFIFSAQAAGIIGEFNKELSDLIIEFAEVFGVAYQIHNDLLDVQDDIELTGRDRSSDQENNKSTYPSLLGLEESKVALANERDKAIKIKNKIKKIKGESFEVLSYFLEFLELK